MKMYGLFLMFWTAVALIGAESMSWYWEAYHHPMSEIRRLLGAVPNGARVIAYRNEVTGRGGLIVWNISISADAARSLHTRCSSPAWILPLDSKVPELQPGATSASPSSASQHAQATVGCLLATTGRSDDRVTQLVLQDDLIQLLVGS